ncbi:MAG: hypothetical protein ACYS99_20860 [Planctomycetota bacterium]|jgi:hypothetical protein
MRCAAAIIARVREAGLQIDTDGRDLLVSPVELLPSDLQQDLFANKQEILVLLRTERPVQGRLLDGGRVWVPEPVREGLCPCDQERVGDNESGLCWTCYGAIYGRRIRMPDSYREGGTP